MKKNMQGFTLIELMIVVAIIAILAAIALPAYQDYVARSQVSEGLSLASGAKTAVVEYYSNYGTFPTDNTAAGVAAATTIKGKYASSVTVGTAGKLDIAYAGSKASTKITGLTLTLTPTDNSGSISWACSSATTGAGKYLPSSCR